MVLPRDWGFDVHHGERIRELVCSWRCLEGKAVNLCVSFVESERLDASGVVGDAETDGGTVYANVPCYHVGVEKCRYW